MPPGTGRCRLVQIALSRRAIRPVAQNRANGQICEGSRVPFQRCPSLGEAAEKLGQSELRRRPGCSGNRRAREATRAAIPYTCDSLAIRPFLGTSATGPPRSPDQQNRPRPGRAHPVRRVLSLHAPPESITPLAPPSELRERLDYDDNPSRLPTPPDCAEPAGAIRRMDCHICTPRSYPGFPAISATALLHAEV